MITNLRGITSLNNLGRKGQVATLLILMMVAVLVFILATVNIGQTSLTATNLANAADAGALYLGSQLATKSNVLYESLGNTTSKCQEGGWASVVFSIVLAVAVIVLAPYLAPGLVGATTVAGMSTGMTAAVGAIGGAVGGAIGGGIAGTGVVRGGITGAIVGAGIGAGVSAGAGAGGNVAGSGGATVETGVGGTIQAGSTAGSEGALVTYGEGSMLAGETISYSAGAPMAAGGTIETGAAISSVGAFGSIPAGATVVGGSTLAGAGAVSVGALATSAPVYNKSVSERMTAAAFDAAARALNGLPEYDRYREGVFLQALSQTIDDPNSIQDYFDYDEDGDTEELVPYFQYWWDVRMGKYKEIVSLLQSLTQGFLNNTDDFVDEITVDYLNLLSGTISEVGNDPALKDYGVTFVSSGSSGVVRDDLGNFATVAEGLLQERDNQGISPLASTWQTWINLFYNSEAGTECAECEAGSESMDFYRMFEVMLEGEATDPAFAGLEEWKRQIEEAREELPDCQCNMKYDEGGSYCVGYTNAPCKTSTGGSIDEDLDDEINQALGDIDTIISGIDSFQNDIYNFNWQMYAAYTPLEYKGGQNPATYSWSDSRGEHSVEVEAGPYKLAWIETRESGSWLDKEICLILRDYSDNGSKTWIKVTRRDPANKDLGILGKWNPTASADEGFSTITRRSRAAYSFNYIKMSGK